MVKIYACLAGEWVCLDAPNDAIGEERKKPSVWWEEHASIWSPIQRKKELEHSFYELDYVKIFHNDKCYRINPCFVQIVNE